MIKFLDLQRLNASFQPELSDAIRRVVDAGWYLRGTETNHFEAEFAEFCQQKYCIGVANGLDALTLVLQAKKTLAGWEDDCEVIVPAMTFVATAQAVVRARLRPVFVDVDEHGLIDPTLLAEAMSPKTRAVIPVHLYGQLADMEAIWQFAEAHNLFVLEDAAQAHGIARAGRSQAIAFSFYPGKNLGALGDGGAVVISDEELAEIVRTFANYGARRKYIHEYSGCNSRLDEVQAAILRVKLKRLIADNARRTEIAQYYEESISAMGCKNVIATLPHRASVYHIFPILSPHREVLQQRLYKAGIETLIHYPLPLHYQPCLKAFNGGERRFPMAEYIAEAELSLPMSPLLTDDEVKEVVQQIQLSI